MKLSKKDSRISLFEPVMTLRVYYSQTKESFKRWHKKRHDAVHNIEYALMYLRTLKAIKISLKILEKDNNLKI